MRLVHALGGCRVSVTVLWQERGDAVQKAGRRPYAWAWLREGALGVGAGAGRLKQGRTA